DIRAPNSCPTRNSLVHVLALVPHPSPSRSRRSTVPGCGCVPLPLPHPFPPFPRGSPLTGGLESDDTFSYAPRIPRTTNPMLERALALVTTLVLIAAPAAAQEETHEPTDTAPDRWQAAFD